MCGNDGGNLLIEGAPYAIVEFESECVSIRVSILAYDLKLNNEFGFGKVSERTQAEMDIRMV